MKKRVFLIIGIIVLLAGLVILFTYNKDVNIEENNTTIIDDNNTYVPPEPVHFDVDSWRDAVNGSDKVVTIIGLTTCPHCQSYKPVAEKLSQENGFKLYFLEMDAMYYEEYSKVKEVLGIEEELSGYPTTFITESGIVKVKQQGYPGELIITDFYKANGLINE